MKETQIQEHDAARRASDHIAAILTFNGISACGKFVAIRLSDGGSDGVLYDTKPDAVRHQLHENMCAYVCILPTGMPVGEAKSFLRTNRRLYDAGMRLSDPDHVIQTPMRREFR